MFGRNKGPRAYSIFANMEEQRQFELWAFGEHPEGFATLLTVMNLWNKNHSDKLEIHPYDDFYGSLVEMKKIWKRETHGS